MHSQHWSDEMWKSKMAGSGGHKKRFQYCTDPPGQEIFHLRALQGHSGRSHIDPSLQDNVLIPNDFFEYIYHIGCAISLHSIINSGLIPGGQNLGKERQTVFFTTVNPMHKNHKDPQELDLTKPRLASYKQKWKRHKDTVYLGRCTACSTERIEVLSNKIERSHPLRYTHSLLFLESNCDESEEIIYQKVHVSLRPPPTISHKEKWMKEIDSEVARIREDIQRIELKPNTQLSSTGRLVTKWSEETLERTEFDRDTLSQEKHDIVTDPTSTERPVCGHESTERCVLTLEHVENDPTSTERPVTVDQKEEHKIDFRVPRLSHAIVKEAEDIRVQELVQPIESHPHREALQADLQQNNAYNPFSNNSKEMIRDLGNVELFESCETTPKVQCSQCLIDWNQGIVYRTCGQCLIYSESRRKFNKIRLDAIPEYVIKKGATHGARHGKTEVQREYILAWNAWKRCCKKVDSQGEHFTGIRDRFLRDPAYRESQLAIGWSEQKRTEMDELAKQNHTYRLSEEEFKRNQGKLNLTLNKASKNRPMRLRPDFRAAVLMKNRLHHESGEPIEERIHPGQRRRIQQGQEVFSEEYFSSARVDQHTGWAYWPPSTSSSWWYASERSWK